MILLKTSTAWNIPVILSKLKSPTIISFGGKRVEKKESRTVLSLDSRSEKEQLGLRYAQAMIKEH